MREDEFLNRISGDIVNPRSRVHRRLGPGLLESAYEACLRFELEKRGRRAVSQLELPLNTRRFDSMSAIESTSWWTML